MGRRYTESGIYYRYDHEMERLASFRWLPALRVDFGSHEHDHRSKVRI